METTGSRYLGEGFRLEPDFREGTIDALSQPVATLEAEPTVTVVKKVPRTNLDYVFDDPAEGEPGRDRMLVHGLWELLLVLALAGLAYMLYREQGSAFSGDGLRQLLLDASILGALGAASAIALRAGIPNLAVGPVAIAAGVYAGNHASASPVQIMLVVIGLSAAVGAVHGLVAVGLHVPGWAVSVGVGLALLVWSQHQSQVSGTPSYNPSPHAYYWFGGFAVLSVIFGLLGLVPSIRRRFGRLRPVADPALRRGVIAAVIAVSATVASAILAGVGGALATTSTGQVNTSAGLELTALGLGAALLGGTSAYGRRGGVFGTVLAVGVIIVAGEYGAATGRNWDPALLAAVAIGLGLVVTRLVERFGRPDAGGDEVEEEDWMPQVHSSTSATRTWPTTPTTTTSNSLWASDEAWGSK
jgi:ribose/xylose/arabinose/galactoside ABC-type transport system permease subunit